MMSTIAGIDLSEQSGDILEPDDQRRRHVDAGDENEREMTEHRDVGGLHFSRRTARLAERDAVEPQEQSGDADQDTENEHDREQRFASERRTHHKEFAHEYAERRQSGDGDDAQDQTPA